MSFYCAMIHTATRAALTVENFRYRLAEGEPVLCEKLDPIFIHLPKGSESFLSVHGEYREDILECCRLNTEKMREAEETRAVRGRLSKVTSPDVLYITCLPWVKFTHIVRTIENQKTDTIPRLSWGKFEVDEKGRLKMPFSVQVHHALMDGYHVCLYLQRLQEMLDQYG